MEESKLGLQIQPTASLVTEFIKLLSVEVGLLPLLWPTPSWLCPLFLPKGLLGLFKRLSYLGHSIASYLQLATQKELTSSLHLIKCLFRMSLKSFLGQYTSLFHHIGAAWAFIYHPTKQGPQQEHSHRGPVWFLESVNPTYILPITYPSKPHILPRPFIVNNCSRTFIVNNFMDMQPAWWICSLHATGLCHWSDRSTTSFGVWPENTSDRTSPADGCKVSKFPTCEIKW